MPSTLIAASKKLIANNETVTGAAVSPGGAWVLIRNGYGYQCERVPTTMLDALNALHSRKRNISCVCFGSTEGWMVVGEPVSASAPAQTANLGGRIADAERRIGQVYGALRAKLNSSQREALKREEIVWIKRKDSFPAESQGRLDELESRIAELQSRLSRY